ncbi:EscU/YscU/HrcU family type III secretion system export apparatus switch protein [Roseateles violae]|uniref:Flagellar type III secretion system protein FlhB n=1 Tax=Roseateles violae TaxID=3058042 RepID=A0ABT8DTF6_9BURK|nr:flagellar type III secretion system protein FlhB [Pelomonas sp. PFR6]MDN3921581.1 flagellar type III secretion system protein FlhB [Pelomonas sp. PFR6]
MAEQGSGDKTEKPSQQKLKKAKEQGQVVRSRDLATAVGVLLSLKLLLVLMPGYLDDFAALFQLAYAPLDSEGALDNLGSTLLMDALLLVVKMVAPLAIVPAAVVLSSLLPGGWVFSSANWAPKFGRLSPVANLGRLFAAKHFSELAQSILKVGCLLLALAHVAQSMSVGYVALQGMSLDRALLAGADMMVSAVMSLAAVFLLFALIDVPLQSFFFLQGQRMSKQEVKEEHKSQEGSPEVRQRIRQLQRALSRRGVRQAVPGADVVIVNPEHYAVALKYDEKRAEAPFVLAKGVDEMALYIREVAKEHQVQVLTLPPLARAIYNSSQVRQQIPASLYKAVAQVLGYVMQLQAFRRGARTSEPPLPTDLPVPAHLT